MRRKESESLSDRVRLEHMLEAAHKTRRFVQGRRRSDLDHDELLEHALLSTIAIIGEAAARTGPEGRARIPSLPWGQIVAMRHVLVHVYWGVDRERLWNSAVVDVPALIELLEAALRNWPLPEPPSPAPGA